MPAALDDGHRFWVLNIVDDFTRECLALVVDTSLSRSRVARELNELIARRSRPPHDRLGQWHAELVSRAILGFGEETAIQWHDIAPGQADPERLRGELQRLHT